MTDDVTARLAAIDDWLDDQDWSTQPSNATVHVRYLLDLRREERSWRGLLAFLDEYYPADVPIVSDINSPDPGPRITAMARRLAMVSDLCDHWLAYNPDDNWARKLQETLYGEVSS